MEIHLEKIVRQALREDAAWHDITTRTLVEPKRRVRAQLIAKEAGLLCGIGIFKKTFQILDANTRVKTFFRDGKSFSSGQVLAQVSGKARSILSGERVALNFLQRLSGIATLTAKFVQQVQGTKAKILDTRKTTPTLRAFERYAVRTGGGVNHRFDLKSAVMVKDNHLALVGSLQKVMERLQKLDKKIPIIIEVDTLAQLKQALASGARYIQLDNMNLAQMRRAVQLAKGKCQFEATGGMSLTRVRAVAQTGVDFISVGAITHSAPAVDLSLEFD